MSTSNTRVEAALDSSSVAEMHVYFQVTCDRFRLCILDILDPDSGAGTNNALDALLKRTAPPRLRMEPDAFGWFYVGFGPSRTKLLRWASASLFLGLVFAASWLGFVDRLNLQGAFTVESWVASIIDIVLGFALVRHK